MKKNNKDCDVVIKRRKKGFTQVGNHFIEDPNLSWKAKGIFIYILSRPDGWKLNVKGDVTKRSTDGERSIYSGLRELIEQGYISRTRDENFYITYHIFEYKEDNDEDDYLLSRSQNADVQNADVQNADVQNSDDLIILKDNNTKDNNTNSSNEHAKEKSASQKIKEKNSKKAIVQRLIDNGVSEELAEEYWHYRVTIKKDRPSDRAITLLINECKSNNFDLSDAIDMMISRGWKGFKYQWLLNERGGNNMQRMSKREAVEANNNAVTDLIKEQILRGEF